MNYDYKNGLNRIRNILKSANEVEEIEKIPLNDKKWTFKNGIKSWTTAIFVDIVNSTKLIKSNTKRTTIAKILRVFCSESIRILKLDDDYREIGIRGDCVYAIYSTPYQSDINSKVNIVTQLNTLMKMINKELKNNKIKPLKVGIGISASVSLIIKAGIKNTINEEENKRTLNDKIWIGDSVFLASKLSSKANRNNKPSILCNNDFYFNLNETNKKLFKYYKLDKNIDDNFIYGCENVEANFDNWIEQN